MRETVRINPTDFANLAICAIRYCHGRQTYMPSLAQGIVRAHLKEVSDNDLKVMIDDCDYQEHMKLYGDEIIDKPDWLRWRQDLVEELERRKNENA